MMLGRALLRGDSDYIATVDSPGFQRFQELARVAGLSRAFTLSVQLGLYTILRDHEQKEGQNGLTTADISEQLGLKAPDSQFRGVTDWLDLLVSIDTLQRTGEGQEPLYSNTPDADQYLAKQSSQYMGGHAVLYHDRTFPQLLWLEDSLKTGAQPDRVSHLVTPVRDTFAGKADTSESSLGGDPVAFALGMTGCNRPAFQQLAAQFDFSSYNTLGDIGGSAGVLSCCVAAAHSHMTCTTYDLPAVHEAAAQYIQQQGLTDQVNVRDIDFFASTPLPSHDVIAMSMILHDWGLERKMLLMQKAFDALPAGGAFIALDVLIDDSRRKNPWGLLMSLDMLMEFGHENSFDYSFQEFASWATKIGFKSTQLIRLVGPNSAAVAYK